MSSAVLHFVESFNLLTEEEQREAATEILKLSIQLGYPPLDDQTIDRIAEETFLEYDAREAADGKS